MNITPQEITAFWLAAGPKQWFQKSDAFDAELRAKFSDMHHAAARGELDNWSASAEGALALVLVLDQFPRNLFRGSPHAFATDPKARAAASDAIARGYDRAVETLLQPFFYLPFEHSETLADQERSLELFQGLMQRTGDSASLEWARSHYDIIARFGRFPHRNASLARETTPEEQAFLDGGGFAG
jgi:uncharacterized protein (DUF924 family)